MRLTVPLAAATLALLSWGAILASQRANDSPPLAHAGGEPERVQPAEPTEQRFWPLGVAP